MKVCIKKEATIIVEIPDDKISDYFGDNINESDFIYWADKNMDLTCPFEAYPDNNECADGWVNEENILSIDIEGCPKDLKAHYSRREIDKINEERERIERCDDCTAVGDDYFTDDDGNLISSCETCPFNSLNNE